MPYILYSTPCRAFGRYESNRAVRDAITQGLETLPADTMAQYFRHSGYIVPVRLATRTRAIVLACVMAAAVIHDLDE